MFSNKNKSKRPKFLLHLRINELINIPQSTGFCYIKWHLKDGTGTSSHSLTTTNDSTNVSKSNHGTTPRATVLHHKAKWNYELEKPVQVKLQVDKNNNLASKTLRLEIFMEFLNENDNSSMYVKMKNSHLQNNSSNDSTNSSQPHVSSPIRQIKHAATTGSTPLGRSSSLRTDSSVNDHRNALNEQNLNKTQTTSTSNSIKKVLSSGSNTNQSKLSRTKSNHSATNEGSHNNALSKISSNNSNNTTVSSQSRNSMALRSASTTSTACINQKITGRLQLGVVTLNIADYVRDSEQPITNRFLLKNSKVNSILNITIKMELNRGSYEDFNIPTSFTSGQLPGSFHAGIGDILEESSTTLANSNGLTSPTSSFGQTPLGPFQHRSTLIHGVNGTSITSSITTTPNTISASMSPVVDSLYQKTFQLPWDPRPGEYTPRECVEDILRGGNGWAKNEKGINLIDLQALSLKEEEAEYYASAHYSWNVYHDHDHDIATSGKHLHNRHKNIGKSDNSPTTVTATTTATTANLVRANTTMNNNPNYNNSDSTKMNKYYNMNRREFIEKKNNLNETMLSRMRSPEDQLFGDDLRDTKSWSVTRIES
ncbi:hypothetical protein TBLA_0I01070 [Henningerozyma blattae CBS 6284]|uniref:C2 NT-type domain-containing protein n=1 Tax=Henningerozyma blattae (strain ATCC 34711 / CBS 6284 / DSM 70876 / NBRC 10599 / NRRL Y-10934 / UCD 77-7) TaxID=1071380 RepID=I2H8R4_HENB6|nr:hypothetical protein TBLA_0I01070 [Tetrapisispora blattae CBS 6284]CCH62766.1 hypothetical protein TBLA_0I01070 [Tetrapisispora blattae CBS 6284]